MMRVVVMEGVLYQQLDEFRDGHPSQNILRAHDWTSCTMLATWHIWFYLSVGSGCPAAAVESGNPIHLADVQGRWGAGVKRRELT